MDEELKVDPNSKPVIGFVTDDSDELIRMGRIDDATKGLKVMIVGGTGSGTVTQIDTGVGLTGGPITTSGTIELDSKLAPLDTLGTAGQSIRVNAGATALEYYTPSAGGITIGTTTITGGTTTRVLYNNAGVVGEYTTTGSGTVVAMQTAPTFVTSITTPSVLATTNDSGAIGASGTAFSDLFLASGGVINWASGDVTITHSTDTLAFAGATSGYTFGSGVVRPSANDGTALGTGSNSWSDLFLADGAVINFNNGNVVLTHSSGILTLTTGTLALGSNSLTMTGSIAATGARVTKGWFTDIESTNAPTVGGVALPTASSTTTFTNKRIQPRTASSTTASTLTPDLSSANVYYRTTQTGSLTINAPTGTPVIGETIAIYVDSAGAQTLTMDATYIPFGAAFPASTTAGKTLMITAQYNGTNWKTLWSIAV